MLLKVFSIYDTATEAFAQPFFMLTQAEAVRAFTTLVREDGNKIKNNPHDFKLFAIATYDNSTGMFTQEKLIDLGSAANYSKEIQEELPIHPVDLTS